MIHIEIERELEIGDKGGEWLAFADVDGDGKKEMIFRQSGGMFHSDVYKESGHGYITDANQDLLQFTCMRQDGEILWQQGEPWGQERPYNSHGGTDMTALGDVDGDGKSELFYLYKDKLYVADAETGAPPVGLRRTADRGGPAGMQKNVYSEPSALMHRLRTCTIRGWIKLFERAGNGTRTRRVRHPMEGCR